LEVRLRLADGLAFFAAQYLLHNKQKPLPDDDLTAAF
jgi:hypothetical protein